MPFRSRLAPGAGRPTPRAAAHSLGRAELPTAGSIDSQSVKAADTIGADSRGYDAGKRINGRKRHVVVDSLGLLLTVLVTAASVQDRDGAFRLLALLRERFSTISLIWADGGYASRLVSWAGQVLALPVTIVKRRDDTTGFAVLPRRWVWGSRSRPAVLRSCFMLPVRTR
jgi:transposase